MGVASDVTSPVGSGDGIFVAGSGESSSVAAGTVPSVFISGETIHAEENIGSTSKDKILSCECMERRYPIFSELPKADIRAGREGFLQHNRFSRCVHTTSALVNHRDEKPQLGNEHSKYPIFRSPFQVWTR